MSYCQHGLLLQNLDNVLNENRGCTSMRSPPTILIIPMLLALLCQSIELCAQTIARLGTSRMSTGPNYGPVDDGKYTLYQQPASKAQRSNEWNGARWPDSPKPSGARPATNPSACESCDSLTS